MGFLGDLSSAIYDIKHYNELSRRSVGRVIATFSIVVMVLGLVSGFWYVNSAGDLVGVVAEEVKVHMPDVAINNGILSSPVQQPYIVTNEDLTPEFFDNLQNVISDRFHVSAREFPVREAYDSLAEAEPKLFTFVLDTTGTYLQQNDPDEYQIAVLVDERAIRVEGQAPEEPQEQRFAELALPSPITITPELLDVERAKSMVRAYLSSFVPLFSILGILVTYGLATLFIGAVGFVAALLAKRPFDFAQTYKMAVYALVPVTLFNVIRVMMLGIPWPVPLLVHLAFVLAPILLTPRIPESSESAA